MSDYVFACSWFHTCMHYGTWQDGGLPAGVWKTRGKASGFLLRRCAVAQGVDQGRWSQHCNLFYFKFAITSSWVSFETFFSFFWGRRVSFELKSEKGEYGFYTHFEVWPVSLLLCVCVNWLHGSLGARWHTQSSQIPTERSSSNLTWWTQMPRTLQGTNFHLELCISWALKTRWNVIYLSLIIINAN